MASWFRSFNTLLIRRPLAAQCATSAVLFGAGDVIAQQAVERRGTKHDLARTARLAFYGGALFGPPVSKWIGFLSRLRFATPAKAAVYSTFIDQTVMAPLVVGWFFTSMSIMEGKGASGVIDSLNTMYAPTLLRGWSVASISHSHCTHIIHDIQRSHRLVYTPTQMINFSVVPPQFRFVFVGVVSLFWNTYLSVVNARSSKDIAEPVGY
ncbi:hypothetical protein BC834DRAFT_858433 [Gloeopeniophorella convolvens]|nr:hypothetical protein BC834DRAFT_858433 [Gloeopeniophorella convolvens]